MSVGGPRLGFIVLVGKQSLVSSIKLSERFDLFRKQALRPYKRAIGALSVALVILAGGLVALCASNVNLQKQLKHQSESFAKEISQQKNSSNKQIAELNDSLKNLNKQIKGFEEKVREIRNRAKTVVITPRPIRKDTSGVKPLPQPNPGTADLNKCIEDVYHVVAIPHINGDPILNCAWSGTGFLLNNGYFVTAQHMVHIDEFDLTKKDDGEGGSKIVLDETSVATQLNALYYASLLQIKMICTSSKGDKIEFDYMYNTLPFKCGSSAVKAYSYKDSDGRYWNIYTHQYGGGDWACAKVNQVGGLAFDSKFSKNLPMNTELHVLGFPSRQGTTAQGSVSPIYSKAFTSRQGLEDDGTVKTSNDNTDHGNSGGPVLVQKDGKFVVVGVLSGANLGSDSSHRKGRVIPIGAAF